MRIYIAYSKKDFFEDLKQVIESKNLGAICGDSDGEGVQVREVIETHPDVVITEQKLYGMDGIKLAKELKEANPKVKIVMAGESTDKKTIAQAYMAGVTYYVTKPLHQSETSSVLHLLRKQIELGEMLSKIQKTMDEGKAGINSADQEKTFECRCRYILSELGISHEKGSTDIVQICWYLYKNHVALSKVNLESIFQQISASPRTAEQRVRRAISAGLTNMALLGMHDSGNETYARYCNNFYPIADLRMEIEYLEGKRLVGGKISIKKFLNAMLSEFQAEEADKVLMNAM